MLRAHYEMVWQTMTISAGKKTTAMIHDEGTLPYVAKIRYCTLKPGAECGV